MNWKQDINLRKRARIRREIMCRMHDPVSNLTLIVAVARILSVLDGESSEESFQEHLQWVNDWLVEIECSARLARRRRRVKQPGTLAKELTQKRKGKSAEIPGSVSREPNSVESGVSEVFRKNSDEENEASLAPLQDLWRPFRQKALLRSQRALEEEAIRGLGQAGRN